MQNLISFFCFVISFVLRTLDTVIADEDARNEQKIIHLAKFVEKFYYQCRNMDNGNHKLEISVDAVLFLGLDKEVQSLAEDVVEEIIVRRRLEKFPRIKTIARAKRAR